jgi:hypothetical protein
MSETPAPTEQLHRSADHRIGADDAAHSDRGARPDHCTGIDGHLVLDLGRGVNDRAWRYAFRVEQRGWTQRIGVELARDSNKAVVGPPSAQHIHMSRGLRGKTFGHQARAGARGGERIGMLVAVEKGEIMRARSIKRRNVGDDMIEAHPGAGLGPGKLRDALHRDPGTALEKQRLDHSTPAQWLTCLMPNLSVVMPRFMRRIR